MNLLAKIGWGAQVCLTAAMTLVAGIPRFDCRCIEGQVKPFSLVSAYFVRGSASSGGSQCCCGRCCSSTANGDLPCCSRRIQTNAPPCCGQAKSLLNSRPLAGTNQITPAQCCVKTLSLPQGATLTKTQRSGERDLTPDALAATQALVLMPVPPSSSGPCGPLHSLAPPGDLLTLLQHLLI